MRTSCIRIIERGGLESFWRIHPDSKPSLESWYSVVRAATWTTPAEMKAISVPIWSGDGQFLTSLETNIDWLRG
jgi:hypothetical protein